MDDGRKALLFLAFALLTQSARADDPVTSTGLTAIAPASKYDSLAQSMAATSATPAERLKFAAVLAEGLDAAVVPTAQIDAISSVLHNQHGAFARSSMLVPLSIAPMLPEQLLPHLTWVTSSCEGDDLRCAFRAIGSIRTRESAKFLVDCAARPIESKASINMRDCAFDALVVLSGHSSFRNDISRWKIWLADVTLMDETTWQRELARGQAYRAADAAIAQSQIRQRLLDSLRELHITTPPDKRDGLLAKLLSDNDPAVRDLGFEITRREMSEGVVIGPKSTSAVLALLRNESDAIRIDAALLLSQLAPKDAAPQLTQAIEEESSPQVASALLVAALAYADTLDAAPLMRWLEVPGPQTSAAVDLGYALLRAGRLEAPPQRANLMTAARAMLDSGSATWSVCHILGYLGGAADQVALVKLLNSRDREAKLAAGDILSVSPDFLDPVTMAARTDSDLFEVATRTLVLHRQDLTGFRTLAALPAPDQESRRKNLLMFAGMCPALDLLTMTRSMNVDPLFLEGMLSSLATENRILSERADPKQLKAIADGIVWLARIRLDLKKPDSALAAISALPEIEEVVTDLHLLTKTRLESWICLGRLNEAAKLDATFDDWIAALKRCPQNDQFPEIISTIDSKFKLTPEQRALLDTLVSKR